MIDKILKINGQTVPDDIIISCEISPVNCFNGICVDAVLHYNSQYVKISDYTASSETDEMGKVTITIQSEIINICEEICSP